MENPSLRNQVDLSPRDLEILIQVIKFLRQKGCLILGDDLE